MKFVPVFIALFTIGNLLNAQDRLTGETFTTRSEILARNGMAATSQPLATQAALDILKKGGSAMDAAIAANAVLGLVEPASCGIGGDIFAIVWSASEQKLYGFNGSGRAPKSLSIDYFTNKGMKYVPFYGEKYLECKVLEVYRKNVKFDKTDWTHFDDIRSIYTEKPKL